MTLQNQQSRHAGKRSALGLASVVLLGPIGYGWLWKRAGRHGSASAYSKPMSPRKFDEAARQCRLSPMMLSRARRVLVKGESIQAVARADRVSMQTVNTAVRMVSTPPDELDERLFA